MALSCGIKHRLFWRSVLPKGQTYVYFLQAEINGGVKIGFANRVGARVRTLQTGNEHELRILAVIPAPPSVERAYHRLLSEERSRNEWFRGPRTVAHTVKVMDIADAMIAAYDGSGNVPDIYDFDDAIERPAFGPSRRKAESQQPELKVIVREAKKGGRQSRVSGNYFRRGLRRGWRSAQIENTPITQHFVDPATMDRTPSRIRSFEPPKRLDEAA